MDLIGLVIYKDMHSNDIEETAYKVFSKQDFDIQLYDSLTIGNVQQLGIDNMHISDNGNELIPNDGVDIEVHSIETADRLDSYDFCGKDYVSLCEILKDIIIRHTNRIKIVSCSERIQRAASLIHCSLERIVERKILSLHPFEFERCKQESRLSNWYVVTLAFESKLVMKVSYGMIKCRIEDIKPGDMIKIEGKHKYYALTTDSIRGTGAMTHLGVMPIQYSIGNGFVTMSNQVDYSSIISMRNIALTDYKSIKINKVNAMLSCSLGMIQSLKEECDAYNVHKLHEGMQDIEILGGYESNGSGKGVYINAVKIALYCWSEIRNDSNRALCLYVIDEVINDIYGGYFPLQYNTEPLSSEDIESMSSSLSEKLRNSELYKLFLDAIQSK